MLRSIIHRVPGRLVVGNLSLYSKGGTTIDQELHYELEPIAVNGLGKIDNRDKEAYYRITMTPDGRMSPDIAAALWLYNNPVIGQGIFTDTDVPGVVHGNDNSKDTYTTVAVENMPQMIFHPIKTLVGQMTLLALRGGNMEWSGAASLLKEEDTGGAFVDATLAGPASIPTQDYTLTWGNVAGWAGLDFYDGLTFEPRIDFIDDEVASQGLFNRHIAGVTGIVRGIPLGPTRQMIQTALNVQGTSARRGASGAAKCAQLTITGADGKVYLTFPLAQLIQSKKQNGVEQLREGEVAFELLPSLAAGQRGPFFTPLVDTTGT